MATGTQSEPGSGVDEPSPAEPLTDAEGTPPPAVDRTDWDEEWLPGWLAVDDLVDRDDVEPEPEPEPEVEPEPEIQAVVADEPVEEQPADEIRWAELPVDDLPPAPADALPPVPRRRARVLLPLAALVIAGGFAVVHSVTGAGPAEPAPAAAVHSDSG
ncbi:MAG: hypothetical protein JWQ26_1785, partial [Modestobacter sp.]|nr:hypothetical protein [Modestobacter sp.]